MPITRLRKKLFVFLSLHSFKSSEGLEAFLSVLKFITV